jgi:aspartate/tyrosine/aromatic aminotransferase
MWNEDMPPTYGEALVHIVLTDDALKANWRAELDAMLCRITGLRQLTARTLNERVIAKPSP